MSMNMKQLKYVLVLAECGSFSRAADTLGISQPSLSQYIKKIEQQLGTELFIRANGDVRLTDAGQVYLDAGKNILALEHQMENKLTDIAVFKSGTISIGISPYRSVHFMPKVLAEFDKKYPGIKLIVVEKSGSNLLESATRGSFDICVIALPVDTRIFDYEIIQKEELVIAVQNSTPLCRLLCKNSESNPSRKFPAVDITLVNGYDFAELRETMLVRSVTDRILDMYNVSVNKKIELSSNEALLSIVKSGVCASFIPSGLADCSSEEISFFSIRQEFDFRNIALIWRKDQYLSEPIRELIATFKALA